MLLKRNRYKWAFRFGKLEHLLSRILFVLLVLSYVLYKLKFQISKLLLASIFVWLGYWLSHRLEKKLHPNH